MSMPQPLKQFVFKQIERLAAPLCIEYDANFHVRASQGPISRYGLHDLELTEALPEALDFIQGLEQDEPVELSFVTLPTGVVAHLHLRQFEGRRFLILFDATEQHRLVQSQQQQANEVRLLSDHQQRTLTELSAANAAIEKQREELEQLNRAQARFIAMMSHEFRTPINAILGYADLLIEDGAPSDRVGAIRRSGWHLLTMVENVLEQARLGRDQVTVVREPTAIGELVHLMNDLFQTQAKERDLALRISQSPSIPGSLLLDVMRIRQILINLIGNALRYTAKGEIAVNLSYQDGNLRLVVQDSGPGIAPADQQRIFRPYERGHGSPGGGAGLGLAICRQLAETMDGSLTLESQLGRGSRFIFQVPAKEPKEEPPRQLYGSVLVLDDDPDLRQWMNILLTDWGLETTLVSSLEEARTWLQDNPGQHSLPDLLITDYQLEDGVGVEAMNQFRAIDPHLPVVMLTGSVPAEEGARMTHDPHFMLLAKPISAAALQRTLGTVLHAGRDELGAEITTDPLSTETPEQRS